MLGLLCLLHVARQMSHVCTALNNCQALRAGVGKDAHELALAFGMFAALWIIVLAVVLRHIGSVRICSA